MSQRPDAPLDNRPLGGFLVILGVAALIATRLQTSRSLVTPNDPGPWFLPLGLAAILLVGGVVIFWRSWRTVTTSARADIESPTTKVRGWFLAGLAAYLLSLPWLGFLAGTALFITALLWLLKVVWWRAVLAGLILTFTAFAIFGWGFNVQLPAGFGN